jgi:hypothetical protein
MVGVPVELPTRWCTDFLIAQDLKFSKLEPMQRSPKFSSTSYVSMQTSLGISKAYLDMLVLMFRQ